MRLARASPAARNPARLSLILNAHWNKATRPECNHGFGITIGHDPSATPSEYLDRLQIANRIFNDNIRLERVVETPKGLSIVTSQPFIEGRDATRSEIDSFMWSKGFKKVGEGTYHHTGEGLLVHDLVSRNVEVDSAGRIHPIDPAITRVPPEFIKNRYR
jgi:hypothetical protein